MRNKNEIKREVKFDTNNFTEEIEGWHYASDDKEEFEYTYQYLIKHYKYVDYYIGDKGYYLYASNTINYDKNPCDINYKKGQ